MISRHVIYCDHYPDGAGEAGSNARERKPATVSHEFHFLELQLIIICFQGQSATTLFASKHDHRMSRSIRFVIARRKSQSNCYFKFLPAISLFCPLFHFFVRYIVHYFNKNSKTTSQSDLRNNYTMEQHFISTAGTLKNGINRTSDH